MESKRTLSVKSCRPASDMLTIDKCGLGWFGEKWEKMVGGEKEGCLDGCRQPIYAFWKGDPEPAAEDVAQVLRTARATPEARPLTNTGQSIKSSGSRLRRLERGG